MSASMRLVRWAVASSIVAGALALATPAAHATHVSCGDTITSDTTLDSDLVDCPGTGLWIGADGVTLDLGGHLVDGTPLGGGAGVFNLDQYDNVTIRNGVVQQFCTGVEIHAAHNVLSDLELRDNCNWGAQLIGAHFNTLQRLYAHGNRTDGIRLGEGMFSDANDNRIEDSRFEQNREDGIAVNHSERNVFSRNLVTGNGEHGIQLIDCCTDADGNALVENRLFDNGTLSSAFSELALGGEDGGTIEGNSIAGVVGLGNSDRVTIAYNDLGGVLVTNSDETTGAEMQIYGNVVSGDLFLRGMHDSTVAQNKILPSQEGISLGSSERNVIADNVIKGGLRGISTAFQFFNVENRYERNRVMRTELEGMYITGENDVVRDNRVLRAGEDGIFLNGLAPVVGGNTANHNGGWGIRAPVDAIDAGGNRAHANRMRLQCLNVRCK